MHISVAIVGYRNSSDIFRCLQSLQLSTFKDFDVVICENGGKDAFIDLSAGLPKVLRSGQALYAFCADDNLGFAGGVNACIRAAPEADGWWILNPDTEPDRNALTLLVERLKSGFVDAVGCTVKLPNGHVQSYGGEWQPWRARAVSIGYDTVYSEVLCAKDVERQQNYLNGASMLVTRRFVATVGLMREDYFLYCEEVEWCLRAIARGMRLGFEKSATVIHHVGTTTGNSRHIKQRLRMPVYLSERNRMLLTRDCFPKKFPIAVISGCVMVFIKYGRKGAWRQVLYGLSGWWDGVLNKRGVPSWHSLS